MNLDKNELEKMAQNAENKAKELINDADHATEKVVEKTKNPTKAGLNPSFCA